MPVPDDPRALITVVADSDWKLACALASSTGTEPEIWFGLLQKGVPFSALQDRAAAMVRKRVEHFRAKKRRPA